MSLEKLNAALVQDVEALRQEGRAKAPERVLSGYVAPRDGRGPRYTIEGTGGEFLRMNSNSYLSLIASEESLHAKPPTRRGTSLRRRPWCRALHRRDIHDSMSRLEDRIARLRRASPAAKIFNSAPTRRISDCALTLTEQDDVSGSVTQLNHNCIIRGDAYRERPAREQGDLRVTTTWHELEKQCIENVPDGMDARGRDL